MIANHARILLKLKKKRSPSTWQIGWQLESCWKFLLHYMLIKMTDSFCRVAFNSNFIWYIHYKIITSNFSIVILQVIITVNWSDSVHHKECVYHKITHSIRIYQSAEKFVAGVADEPRGEKQADIVETTDLDGHRVEHRHRRQRRGTSRRRIC